MKFKIISFNEIQNHIIQWNSKLYFNSVQFNIFYEDVLHLASKRGYLELKIVKGKTQSTILQFINKQFIIIIRLLIIKIPYRSLIFTSKQNFP